MAAATAAAPPPLSIRVLGGGRDVGRSCLLLTLGARRVLLDCGAHPGYADGRRFPALAGLPPLDAVLVTHFHLDHAGALPLLRSLQNAGDVRVAPPPVVMTAPTKAMTALMLRDFYDTSAARKQRLPFGADDVRHALDAAVDVSLGGEYSPPGAPDLVIEAYYAGHVLGAVMSRIAVAGVGTVVYSGDYTTAPDALLRAADVPPPPAAVDLFITEATYCGTLRRAPRSAAESELATAVVGALRAGGKVLVPVSALGRAHELIAVLAPLFAGPDAEFADIPVFAAAGLLAKASAVYDEHGAGWCCGGRGGADGRDTIPQLREFQRARDWPRVLAHGAMLLFATPGNLSTGVSLDAFRAWCGSPRNVAIVPGFCFANTVAARLLAGNNDDAPAADAAIRCRLLNMSLGAHADARGIARTARRLRPRAVMLVHGEEAKIAGFAPRLRTALGGNTPVLAPANGDSVDLRALNIATTIPAEVRRPAKRSRFSNKAPSTDPPEPEPTLVQHPFSRRGARQLAALLESPEVDGRWRAAAAAYDAGAGHWTARTRTSGAARRPVADGGAALSRLYAELLPHAVWAGGAVVYRGRVSAKVCNGAVEVAWTAGKDELEARVVLDKLETAASPPGSPA